MAIMKPKQRNKATRKGTGIPTRIANPTNKAGAGRPRSRKTSQRFNRAMLYRAKGERII